MAIYQRGDGYQVVIRRKGHPAYFRTWPTKAEAENDQAEVDARIRKGNRFDPKVLRSTTVRDLLIQYDQEECERDDRNGRKESNRINVWLQQPWTLLSLEQDISGALRAWGKQRLREVEPSTHNRDLNLLSSIFSHAIKEWGIDFVHPIRGRIKRPEGAEGEHRDLLWTDADIQVVLDYFKFDETKKPTCAMDYVPWTILTLRHTGLRLGQLTATQMDWLRLENPRAPEIHFPAGVVKNRAPHKLPLSTRGLKWISALASHREGETGLFGFPGNTIRTFWSREVRPVIVKDHPHLVDHRLHDLRHTWTTEMVDVRKVPLPQLMKISGRKSERELMRYYNPTAETLAPLMG